MLSVLYPMLHALLVWSSILQATALVHLTNKGEFVPGRVSDEINTKGELVPTEEGAWWTQVGDQVFHAPKGAQSRDSWYYYTVGSPMALTQEMLRYRVGGSGLLHVLYLPSDHHLLNQSTSCGSRRESMSLFKALRRGQVMSGDLFPEYTLDSAYEHPLDQMGKYLELQVVTGVTNTSLMQFESEIVEIPSKKLPTRSYTNDAGTKGTQKYIVDKFTEMGLSPCIQNFRSSENVVALIKGGSTGTVTLGAHYDSRPFDGAAPGAVDNGSGLASLLAIAKAVTSAGVTPEKSVYLVAFGAEEAGLWGSEAFAKALTGEGPPLPEECKVSEGPHNAIIMDEVAWKSPALTKPTVNLESYEFSKPLLEHLAQSNKAHNGDALYVEHSYHPFGSDHMPFLQRNMNSALTIMGDDVSYPDYHSSRDRIKNVNVELMTMIAKMNAGALLRVSGVDSGVRHEGLRSEDGVIAKPQVQ